MGHLNGFFAPRGGNLNKPIFKSSNARGVARGGMLNFRIDRRIIPQLTYCIADWGNCAVAIFTEIERLHIKVTSIIHKIPEDILDCNVLDHIKWQDLGYLYKRRIAIEVFTAKQGLNNRLLFLPFLTFTKSKYKDLLLELITKMKENRS